MCPLVLPIYHSLVTGKSREKVTLDRTKHMANTIDSFALTLTGSHLIETLWVAIENNTRQKESKNKLGAKKKEERKQRMHPLTHFCCLEMFAVNQSNVTQYTEQVTFTAEPKGMNLSNEKDNKRSTCEIKRVNRQPVVASASASALIAEEKRKRECVHRMKA